MRAISYRELLDLCAGRIGVHDVACPFCGPARHSPTNRKRRVLRLWCEGHGFISYHCARCGERGSARENGAANIQPVQLKRLQEEAAKRDRKYAEHQLEKAGWLWCHRKPIEGSPAEQYLRTARSYGGSLPATLGFLPASKPEHYPAMVAAFALAGEPEPGVFAIADGEVRGVQLTVLKADGSGKAETERDKIMIGRSSGTPIVLAPMSDSLGLVITEGIEDALTLYEATGLSVWAAGSASRLPALADAVPHYIDCVAIAADDDEAGRAGAVTLAEALRARNLHVELSLPDSRKVAA